MDSKEVPNCSGMGLQTSVIRSDETRAERQGHKEKETADTHLAQAARGEHI